MVLFGLVMGLGMLVDDGIVVVDNVFANMQKGMDRVSCFKNWNWRNCLASNFINCNYFDGIFTICFYGQEQWVNS